jgi:hypothetical protein
MKNILKFGDVISLACKAIGITPEKIERLTGKKCKCRERHRMLNELQDWALGIISGKITGAVDRLNSLLTKWEKRLEDGEESV